MSPTTLITTIAIYLVIFVAVLTLLMQQRPVTQRTLATPVIIVLVAAGLFLANHPPNDAILWIFGGGVLGIGTGLVSAQFMRVWRDSATGVVYQQGNWRYLLVLLVLVAARFGVRYLLLALGMAGDPNLLNIAFVAMACGNLLGRAFIIAQRAATLSGRSFPALPLQ